MRQEIELLFNERADKFELFYLGEGLPCLHHIPTNLIIADNGALALKKGLFFTEREWLEITGGERECLMSLYQRVRASIDDKRHSQGMVKSTSILKNIFKI
jgi:hypothetical protein